MKTRAKAEHPEHVSLELKGGVFWVPARPIEDTSPLHRWRDWHRCKKAGGHWWHPYDAMIDWFCCQCGKITSGMPKDGTG